MDARESLTKLSSRSGASVIIQPLPGTSHDLTDHFNVKSKEKVTAHSSVEVDKQASDDGNHSHNALNVGIEAASESIYQVSPPPA